MASKAALVIAVFALLLLSACSGYRELSKPWNFEPVEGDFESTVVVQAGDQVRVTIGDGQVLEGLFVEVDEGVVAIADTSAETRIVFTSVAEVERFEVYQKGSGKVLRTVALVAATTVVVKAIVDAESGPTFHPDDDWSPAKAR